MASSKRQADQVAREKQRMSLKSGDAPEKAARYAAEVREYARKQWEGKRKHG